nr:hypothetical protein [Mycolicibacterium palauense]
MTGRPWAATVAVALMCGAGVGAAAPAYAAPQSWTGRYLMVTHASAKGGTSPAARQRENDFSAVFTFSTSCATGYCVATAQGPASSNPTVPNPLRYTWDGEQWKTTYEWVWQCSLGAGQSQWSPAQSFTFYTPQPDGSLKGLWHTDISTGACRGSVIMPVAATPG